MSENCGTESALRRSLFNETEPQTSVLHGFCMIFVPISSATKKLFGSRVGQMRFSHQRNCTFANVFSHVIRTSQDVCWSFKKFFHPTHGSWDVEESSCHGGQDCQVVKGSHWHSMGKPQQHSVGRRTSVHMPPTTKSKNFQNLKMNWQSNCKNCFWHPKGGHCRLTNRLIDWENKPWKWGRCTKLDECCNKSAH